MKHKEGFKQRLALYLLQSANARWIYLAVALLLLAVACGKPISTRIAPPDSQRWAKAVSVEAKQKCLAGFDASQDFGRELDTLTSFYEAVISILLGVIGVVAGLAFWTIKVVSKGQAEETAQEAAEKIIGNHDGFTNKLKDAVSREIGERLEEVQAKLEDLEERSADGKGETVEVAPPAQVRSKAARKRAVKAKKE